MCRYRLYPTLTQQAVLLEHCAHARYVWNLAVEQRSWWQPGRRTAPGFGEQCRQLTDARAAFAWLAGGSVVVQQQALRDFQQAWSNHFAALRASRQRSAGAPRTQRLAPPGYRKRGRHEGFRIVAVEASDVRQLNRRWAVISIPKTGWVRFRWTRPVPPARSFRVTQDRAGRWHVAFAAVPPAVPAPGNGQVVGIDRGVAVSAALSTGELLLAPTLRSSERTRLRRLQRSLARARRDSNRRARIKRAVARLRARQADRRRNWTEQTSTDLARRFDLIRVEDLNVRAMTASAKGTVEQPGRSIPQKSGLNRAILDQGWGRLVSRLEDKAPGRVEKVQPAFTSQRCNACGHIARRSRESQAHFRCVACGHTAHADVNAACNIAAGRVVPARGGQPLGRPANREPHHVASSA